MSQGLREGVLYLALVSLLFQMIANESIPYEDYKKLPSSLDLFFPVHIVLFFQRSLLDAPQLSTRSVKREIKLVADCFTHILC